MSRRKVTDEPLPTPAPGVVRPVLRRWTLQVVGLLIAVGLGFVGVMWFNQFAREQLRDRERFQVAISDIDCPSPLFLDQREFLEEVAYHGGLPERVSTLDDSLAQTLQRAFALHPCVAQVGKVDVKPPRIVRVTLTFREPVLAVAVASDLAGPEPANDGKTLVRAVDIHGILLPKKTPTLDLPILHGISRPSAGAGQAWGTEGVVQSAQVAAKLKPHLEPLGISALTWSNGELVLWRSDARILWGDPTSGRDTEASGDEKETRLAETLASLHPLPRWCPFMYEVDLRPIGGVTRSIVARQTVSDR